MDKVNYCLQCKRIFQGEESCQYCGSSLTKELSKNSPVNVMGTKVKGRVLKVKDGIARLLIRSEDNSKLIKEYHMEKLRKVL